MVTVESAHQEIRQGEIEKDGAPGPSQPMSSSKAAVNASQQIQETSEANNIMESILSPKIASFWMVIRTSDNKRINSSI